MRIVMLNGQNHRGSSYHIGRAVIDRIEGEKEVTEFFFPKDLDHFCLGCYRCIEDAAACPFYEEKKVILDAIDGADLLVVTTPTYCMHVSAPLKAFIDLTFDLWMSHRPMASMFTKRALIVSTAAGTGTRGVSSCRGVSTTHRAIISSVEITVSSILPRVRNTPWLHRNISPTGGTSSVSTRPATPRADTARGLEGRSTPAV